MSQNVRGLVQGALDPGSPAFQILSGYVSLNQPAPASFSDPVFVIVPSHDPSDAIGPLTWSADHGSLLPVQGTTVVVGLDEYGQFHLLSWDVLTPPQIPFLPPLLRFFAVTAAWPGGQTYTPGVNVTPPGATGQCYVVATCDTRSDGIGGSIAEAQGYVGSAFVSASAPSDPAGDTTVPIYGASWALS
jgi:hypothetical protein